MKVSIVYATTTGNTEQMAGSALEAAKTAGHEVTIATADIADSAATLASDLILLGSPAMGAEQLEDSMESFFSEIEASLSGKKLALFGSYDWGSGQWLSDWEERAKAAGAEVTGTVKAQLAPDETALEEMKKLIA